MGTGIAPFYVGPRMLIPVMMDKIPKNYHQRFNIQIQYKTMQTVCWWVMTLEFTTVQWKSLGAKNDFDLFDRDLDSSSDPKIQGHTLTLAWFLWIYHADKHTHTHTHTHTHHGLSRCFTNLTDYTLVDEQTFRYGMYMYDPRYCR